MAVRPARQACIAYGTHAITEQRELQERCRADPSYGTCREEIVYNDQAARYDSCQGRCLHAVGLCLHPNPDRQCAAVKQHMSKGPASELQMHPYTSA